MLTAMIELIRIADPVSLQIACDALEDNNIAFTVENAGMNALMPLPELMDARLLVAADDEAAARQIIVDLELMIGGAAAFIAGVRLLFATAELRSVLWRMLGLLALLMLATSVGAFWLLDYMAGLWLPQGDAWYWQLLSALVWVLALLLSLISGAVAYVALGSAAVAPWLDTLALRSERMHGINRGESSGNWLAQTATSLANSVRPLFGLLAWGVLALVLIWIPPLATAIWTWGGIRFLAYELMDTSASRQGWDFSRRQLEQKQRRWFYLGFAGVAMLLLLVPVVNLFVIPAAVVALSTEGERTQAM